MIDRNNLALIKTRGISYLTFEWHKADVPLMIRQAFIEKIIESDYVAEAMSHIKKAGLPIETIDAMLTKIYGKEKAKNYVKALDR